MKAIITSNKSRHNFKIGEVIEIVSTHKDYYKCKGKGMANYFVPFSEAQIINK